MTASRTSDPTRCFWRRAGAMLLDTLIVLTPILGILSMTGSLTVHPTIITFGPGWYGILAIWTAAIAYWTICEATWGKTPGKSLAKIRVVNKDGTAVITWQQSLLRNVSRIVDQFLCIAVGPLLIVTTSDHRRFGDVVGHTLVMRTDAVD